MKIFVLALSGAVMLAGGWSLSSRAELADRETPSALTKPAPEMVVKNEAPKNANHPEFTGQWSDAAAVKLLFGEKTDKHGQVRWQPTDEQLKSLEDIGPDILDENGLATSEVLFSEGFERDGRQCRAVLFQTIPNLFSHATPGMVGGAKFIATETGWRLQSRMYAIATIGTNGAVPAPKAYQIGKNRRGYLFESGFTGQGVTGGGMALIAEFGDSFAPVAQLDDTFSEKTNEKDRREWGYDSKFVFSPAPDAEWYDLTVITTGNYPGKGRRLVKVNRTRRLTFKDGAYHSPDGDQASGEDSEN